MSVIQEALRRKMAEQAERGTAPPPVAGAPAPVTKYQQANAPTTPAPARREVAPSKPSSYPAHAQPVVQPRQERPLSWFVLLFLFLLAGGAATLFFVQSRARQATVVQSSPEVAPLPEGIQESTPMTLAAAPKKVPEVSVSTPVSAEPEPAGDVAAAEEAEPIPSRSIAPKQDTVTRDDWPRIELMGILAGGGEERSTAILNGALIMLNGEVDGVTLADVGEDGVYLEFKGDRQYIRIGEYTR